MGLVKPAALARRFWPKAVFFDLDGTLVDSLPDIAQSLNAMQRDLGRLPLEYEQIAQWVGDGAGRLVKRALTQSEWGEPEERVFDEAYALFLREYQQNPCVYTKPYPHVTQVLAELSDHDIALACVTNKPEGLSRDVLSELQLDKHLEIIVGGDSLPVKKPDPGQIHYVCNKIGVTPKETVYVGDSTTDHQAAMAAEVDFVCVSYGYRRGADLTKLDNTVIISQMDELLKVLEVKSS